MHMLASVSPDYSIDVKSQATPDYNRFPNYIIPSVISLRPALPGAYLGKIDKGVRIDCARSTQ